MLDLSRERDAHIAERLRDDSIIWLGSVRPDGRPHLVAVWFLWTGTDLLVFSKPNRQKTRNLRQNSRVVLAVGDTNHGVDSITLEGVAAMVDDLTINCTLPAYVAKYGADIKGIGYTPETM